MRVPGFRRVRTALLILLLQFSCSAVAFADEGEVSVEAVIAPEFAWLLHPAVHDGLSRPVFGLFAPSGSFTFLPRLGASARYGLTNQLAVRVGMDGAVFPNLRANGVNLDGVKGDLLTGTYAELCAPVSLLWRFDSGYEHSGTVSLAVGPMASVWAGNALADPTRPDAAGLPSALPIDVSDAWRVGAFARLSVGFEMRFFDVLLLALEPTAGVSWSGTPGLHLGLVVRPALGGGIL